MSAENLRWMELRDMTHPLLFTTSRSGTLLVDLDDMDIEGWWDWVSAWSYQYYQEQVRILEEHAERIKAVLHPDNAPRHDVMVIIPDRMLAVLEAYPHCSILGDTTLTVERVYLKRWGPGIYRKRTRS